MLNFVKKHNATILISSMLAYTLLSYVLLFRDKAVDGIAHFYPITEKFLFSTRIFLQEHSLNTIPTAFFGIIMLLAFLAYFRSLSVQLTIKKTITIAIVLQVISFFAFPIIESDIFSYMSSDRVNTVYQQNVWKVAPASLPFDRFSEIADWKEFTRVYGGVNQFIYNFAAKAGNNDFILTLINYKLIVLIFTLLSIFVIYRIAKEFFPDNEAKSIKLIFWNPLFLLNIVGAGHNDIIMLFFMLGSYYFYLSRKQLLSGAFLAFAIQTKLVACFMFPFIFLDLVLKKDFRNAFFFAATSIGITLALFVFMGIGPIEFVLRVLQNSNIYWQGLPSLLFQLTGSKTNIFILGFILINLLLIFYQIKHKANPIFMYCLSVFFYLVLFTSAYWNWYVLWAFTFIPFVKNKTIYYSVLFLTATSTLGYLIYWIALRYSYQNILWQVLLYFFILFLPFLLWITMKWPQLFRINRGYMNRLISKLLKVFGD